MFNVFRNDTNLKLGKLVRILRDARIYNVDIEVERSRDDVDIYEALLKFDHVIIEDRYSKRQSWDNEIHHIEIKIIDGEKELIVYKSPEIDIHPTNFNKFKVTMRKEGNHHDEVNCDSITVKWLYSGEWNRYIVSKLQELEQKIIPKKQQEKTIRFKKEIDSKNEIEDKKRHFNNVFSKIN